MNSLSDFFSVDRSIQADSEGGISGREGSISGDDRLAGSRGCRNYARNHTAASLRKTNKPFQLAVKRFADIVGSAALIVALLPLFVLISVMISFESSGPILFRQARIGLGNSVFRIWKFRTMYVDMEDSTGVRQTTENDPRITPFGRLLRRSNFDELPQLLNILVGDMSFIGPRPHVPGMMAAGMRYDELVANYDLRHLVRPGLTGLAQCRGLRGPTTEQRRSRRRIYNDLEYIRTFSLVLDAKILARTLVREFWGGSGS